MKPQKIILIFSLIAILCFPGYTLALPVLPGAQGVSAETVAGRGGTVYKVTNLNDSGSGSFRACAEASGARICVFETSGWIALTSPIMISNPYITIAGQTSPGGIGIRATTGFSDGQNPGMVYINTHDVLITHMRFAMGAMLSGGIGGDTLRIWGNNYSTNDPSPDNSGVYNIYIDHCSIRWGCDECGETGYNPNRVTIAWSIIGPGLYNCHPDGESNHDLGWLYWGPYTSSSAQFSFHHNFHAHVRYRMPYTSRSILDAWNNVTFDGYGAYTGPLLALEGGKINYRNNYCKKVSGYGNSGSSGREITGTWKGSSYAAAYLDDNIGCYRTAGQDDWLSIEDEYSGNTLSTSWKSDTPFSITHGISPTITTMTASYAAKVVSGAGATKPVTDSVDQTCKTNFTNGTHARYDGTVTGNEASDWPTLSGGSPPTDSDNDGMSDAWEIATFGNLTQTASGDYDSDGYTNIEEYMHYLGGYVGSEAPAQPTGLVIRPQ